MKVFAITAVLLAAPLITAADERGRGPPHQDDYIVAPSGDITGLTDAANLEIALNLAKIDGGTVRFTDGDRSTADHYYVSRGIVIEDFAGTITGEGIDHSLIEVTRGPGGAEFSWDYESPYLPFIPGRRTNYPTMLLFERSQGLVIQDLTLLVAEASLVDESYIWGFQGGGTALAFLIADFGARGDTTVERVRFQGSTGDFRYFCPSCEPTNTIVGIHSSAGESRGVVGEGAFSATDSEAIDVAFAFWAEDRASTSVRLNHLFAQRNSTPYVVGQVHESVVEVAHNRAEGSMGRDIWLLDITGSEVSVAHNTLSTTGRIVGESILLNNVAGAAVAHNTIVGSSGVALTLVNDSDGVEVWQNTFDYEASFSTIFVGTNQNVIGQNDYRDASLPGWTGDPNNGVCDGGPGAIFLLGNDNVVEMEKFPGQSSADIQVCDHGVGNVLAR